MSVAVYSIYGRCHLTLFDMAFIRGYWSGYDCFYVLGTKCKLINKMTFYFNNLNKKYIDYNNTIRSIYKNIITKIKK